MLRRWLPAAIVFAAGCSDKSTHDTHSSSRLSAKPLVAPSVTVTVSGTVIERDTGDPVADVQVVFRGDQGDVTVTARGDGTFSVMIPRGTYRSFVRDARVMSTGPEVHDRVKTFPRAELAGAADEALMSIVDVDGDIKALEIPVVVAGTIEGSAKSDQGSAVGGATFAAVPVDEQAAPPKPGSGVFVLPGSPRPVLGTNTAVSDAAGAFTLRVPPGRYLLSAERAPFAGMADLEPIDVHAGGSTHVSAQLVEGCVITGSVVGPDGAPAHDGMLEVRRDNARFLPSSQIRGDGTFRWSTTREAWIDVRAWPWESAPSPTRSFDCVYGSHIDNIVLRTGNAPPDLAGTIIDASGAPIPLAYLDISPLDRGVDGQQERADASGHFEVYELPAGRYQITASSPGRGIASTMVIAPRKDVTLHLGGTGRIFGTATDIVDGSFELTFDHCGGASSFVDIDEPPRLVPVRGGKFTVENVPACALTYTAVWRDKTLPEGVVIEPGRTAYIELPLGKPRPKTVTGIVRDPEGAPAANARVSAIVDNEEVTSVRTQSDGSFEIKVAGGAELIASNGKRVGRGSVGRANVTAERVELVLDERAGAQ